VNYVEDLPIQRRIAGILSAYDELIENSQRRIRILESMARALYREWFVHFRFPGHESVPRVPSPLGEIPKGWEVKSLADLMDIRGGSQPPKSEFVYEPKEGYVRLIQIRDYESDSHLTFVRESPKLRMVDRTEIMIARYGASVARICSGLTGAYNVALAKVIPTAPNCQEFLRQFLADDEFQKLLIGMSGRAAQNGFNKSDIAAARVPVPTAGSLLEEFERFSVPIRDSILGLHDQTQNLRRTRDLLLPRLLSGQIDVEAMPS
jgi:type I restriction enzyme S subunit